MLAAVLAAAWRTYGERYLAFWSASWAAYAFTWPVFAASFLSGAGPSVALLASRNLEHVSELLKSMYERTSVAASVRVLGVHQSARHVARVNQSSEALTGAAASGHGRTV